MPDIDPAPENLAGLDALRGFSPPPAPPLENNLGLQRPFRSIPERESQVASTLTYVLAGVLVFTIVLQYVTLSILVWHNKCDAIPTFEHLFNAVLPVIAGLTGSAVTYYLTKEKK